MSTVQPYPPTARWRFRSRQSNYEHLVPLAYHWEPNGAPMSDDYAPEEISAAQLWGRWVDRYANRGHKDHPED